MIQISQGSLKPLASKYIWWKTPDEAVAMPECESLKALVYFNDGDLKTLPAPEKSTLVEAVKAVRDLPDVALRSTCLSGLNQYPPPPALRTHADVCPRPPR